MVLEAQVVSALRLEDASKSDAGPGWQLWKYRLRDPASQMQVPEDRFLLFIKSRGLTKSGLPDLKRSLPRDFSVAMQRSSSLSPEIVKAELGVRSVKFLSELLQQECRHILGGSSEVADAFPYFVEPIVDGKLALSKLSGWLVGEIGDLDSMSEEEPAVAVLLAPAGVGKTSVARELARSLALRPQHDVLPLLIEPRQWPSLNPHEPASLWVLIKRALEASGYNAVSEETFELFARARCIVTIFDGLDELSSIRLGTITPVDVISRLRTLSEESDFRILLTSRDGLWSEMVPPEFRQRVREFNLRPFRKEQIARYREKRFPNPKKPQRARFDEILEAVTAAAHPEGTGNVPYGERAPAAPLILHLVATEAEEYSEGVSDYGLTGVQFKNPLYAITYGILNREHTRRNLCLTPAQQFMMISTLVVEMDAGPYSHHDVVTAAEDAIGSPLKTEEVTALKSHPLLSPVGDGIFTFRFEYLARFAPAVWITNHLLESQQDLIAEKYLASIGGRNSPISGYVADLLRGADWKPHLVTHFNRLKQGGADQVAAVPFLWEIAQSLLPPPGEADRVKRTSAMLELFGIGEPAKNTFSGFRFSGLISYFDFRTITFKNCVFQSCEWLNCEFDSTSRFLDCTFRGRWGQVQSGGLRSAVYSPLNETNVDKDAQSDLEKLLDKPNVLSMTRESIIGMLTSILEQFRGAGFYIPRSRDHLKLMQFIGAPVVRDFIVDQLVEHGVLVEETDRGLQVVKKNSASVTALLDNGTLNGAVNATANEVIKRFRPNPATVH